MTTPVQRLQKAAGPPLVAPFVATLAGEVEGLSPREVLSNATKLSGGVRDLTRSLGADVATVEFGSHWDIEAAGAALDWSPGFPPRVAGGSLGDPSALAAGGRAPIVLDAVGRLVTLLGEEAVVAASVTGPVSIAAAVPGVDLREASKLTLAAVRALCDAGVRLIWLVEDGSRPPEEAAALAQVSTPALGTARFYRATAALHLAGDADGWSDAVARLRQAIPCFDPDRSPGLAAAVRAATRPFGVLAGPDGPGETASDLAQDRLCVLLAHDGELTGRLAARDLRAAVLALKRVAGTPA